jgi:hypothetical protein
MAIHQLTRLDVIAIVIVIATLLYVVYLPVHFNVRITIGFAA